MTIATHQQRRILNISVPPELYKLIEETARDEHRTKSELIREAFRHYQFVRRWRTIRMWGSETATRLGIHTDEELEQVLG
jgi:metal-responsive CopG/Arc/MetJ family transcriptional regulator